MIHDGKILDNDDELEYCITTQLQPLVVYIPSDFNQEEYRLFTKLAIDDLESYKRDSYQNITALQKSIEAIVDLFVN